MFVMFLVFHLEMSGKDVNDKQSLNKAPKLVTLLISHLEISGNDINDGQL